MQTYYAKNDINNDVNFKKKIIVSYIIAAVMIYLIGMYTGYGLSRLHIAIDQKDKSIKYQIRGNEIDTKPIWEKDSLEYVADDYSQSQYDLYLWEKATGIKSEAFKKNFFDHQNMIKDNKSEQIMLAKTIYFGNLAEIPAIMKEDLKRKGYKMTDFVGNNQYPEMYITDSRQTYMHLGLNKDMCHKMKIYQIKSSLNGLIVAQFNSTLDYMDTGSFAEEDENYVSPPGSGLHYLIKTGHGYISIKNPDGTYVASYMAQCFKYHLDKNNNLHLFSENGHEDIFENCKFEK